MNNEEKILVMLEQLQQGQAATNNRLDNIDTRLDTMQEDIEQIKEDTAVTREATNTLIEWTEVAASALKIKYPV